jgi:hypothetical protein
MTSLKDLIGIIKTGNPAEVKSAQKQVQKIWNEACQKRELKKEFGVFVEEARSFDEIKDTEHKAYFLNTLKWPFWGDSIDDFPFWSDFILNCVQSPEGKIRLAAVRAAEYLVVEVTGFFDSEHFMRTRGVSPETAKIAKHYFCVFAFRAYELVKQYHKPEHNRYRYIHSLKAGVYKSAQQLLNQSILPSEYFRNIYTDFLAELRDHAALRVSKPGHA